MGIESTAQSLSEIEKKTLNALSSNLQSLQEVATKSGLNIDSVRRSASWLSEKGLAQVSESRAKKLFLTANGKKSLEQGMPERRMLDALFLKGKMAFKEAQEQAGLLPQEFNAALGTNKRSAFIIILKEPQPTLELTEVGKEFLQTKTPDEKALLEISQSGSTQDLRAAKELITRGLAHEKEEIERKISITAQGEQVRSMKISSQRAYNVLGQVPTTYIGKKQPYIQFLNIIRRKLTELGFKEMESPLVVQEFYNFDVLFQPQNHPARTWTDTYQLKKPTHGK